MVTWQMSQKSLNRVSMTGETGRQNRHHTDPIDFKTLLKVSEDLVRSFDSYNTITSSGMSGTAPKSTNRMQHTILQWPADATVLSGTNNRIVQLLEDINESMAKNTDVLISISKENSHRHSEITKSIETMHTLLNMWHKSDDNKGDRPHNPLYPYSSNRTPACCNGCHYCWGPGHFIANCESLAADVAEGKVEAHENGSKVDLRKLPQEPMNISFKDRMDRQWKN